MKTIMILGASLSLFVGCETAQAQTTYPTIETCVAYEGDSNTWANSATKWFKHVETVRSQEDRTKHEQAFREFVEKRKLDFNGCMTPVEIAYRKSQNTLNPLSLTGVSIPIGGERTASNSAAKSVPSSTTKGASLVRLRPGCFTFRRVSAGNVPQIYNGCGTAITVAFCHTTPGTLYTCPEQGVVGPLAPGRAEAVTVPQGTRVRMNACAMSSYHAGTCTPKVRPPY